MSSIANMYDELRRLTVKQLGYDIEKLPPADEVKVSRIVALKLELDRLQTAQLRGEAVDARVLVEVSELLEAALRPAANAPETRFGTAHRAKLKALIERTLFGPDVGQAAALADSRRREEAVMADEACGRAPEAMPAPVTAPQARSDAAAATGTGWRGRFPRFMGAPMSDAQTVVLALELRRAELLARAVAFDALRAQLAFVAITEDSVVARERFHEMDGEACRLAEEIGLTDLALAEARRRATVKDWRQQFAEITGIGS